jgi:hypothetical protein
MPAHRFGRRTLKAIVLLAPLAVLIGLGALMVRRYYREAERDLAPILAAEATRELGHEVRVGKVTLKGGYAYIDNVSVAEGRTMAESGPIATARQVIVDFDLRTILLTRKLPVPLFGNVRVLDPVGRVVRNAKGVWNFADLVKTKPGAKQRSPIGHVTVVNGIVDYSDAALPRNPRRPITPVTAHLVNLNGSATFFGDRSVAWEVRATGTQGKIQTLRSSGSYNPGGPRVLVRAQAIGFSLPLVARFLPPDVNVTSGLASGQVTIIRSPETVARKTGLTVDLQVNANIAGATVVSSRFREPVTNINGAATVGNGVATARLDSGFAGSKLHAEGTLLGFTDPALDGWATGSGIELQRALTALNLDQRYPALRPLRQVQARADLRVDARGKLANLDVRASGPAAVSGTIPGGAVVPQSGQVQVAFSGPLSAPRFVASGTLPVVRFLRYAASNVAFSGVYTPKHGAVSFHGITAGGTVTGRAELFPNGVKTRYVASARARRIDLAAIPLNLSTGAGTLRGAAPDRLTGIANVDLVADGRFDQGVPHAVAEVQAQSIHYAGWEANGARARVRTQGELVFVEPLVVKDEKGAAIVRGTIDTRTNQLDLRAEAERLDVARFASVTDSFGGQGKSKNQTPVEGLAYLRDAHITGTIKDPRFTGKLYAYELQSDKLGIDYAVADVSGSRDSVDIRSATAYRFPASANVSGLVSRPFGKRPVVSLAGNFKDLEALDVMQVAGSDLDVSGTANGTFQVSGPLSQPEITAPHITIADARIGDVDFRSVSGGVRYEAAESGGTWRLDDFVATRPRTNPQLAELTTIGGSAFIDAAKQFHVTATAANVDLDLLAPYVSDYVALAGTARVTADGITGRLVDGKAVDVRGKVLATTQGLSVNDVALGELHGKSVDEPASVTLDGDLITSDAIAVGQAQTGIALARRDMERPALVYNRADDTLQVSGNILSLQFERMRQALAKSPYLVAHPDSPITKYLGPTIAPLEGTLGGAFVVSGTAKSPVSDITWFSENAKIEGQDIQTFEGRIVYDSNRVTITGRNGQADAILRADETVVNGHGTMTLEKDNEQISADADINNFPLALLDRWAPQQPIVKDLSGTIDTVTLQARGRANNPAVTASALLHDITWIETQPLPVSAKAAAPGTPVNPPPAVPSPPVAASSRTFVTRHDNFGRPFQVETTGREFRVRRVEVSTVRINDPTNPNKLRAEDIHVTLAEQAAEPTVTPKTAAKPPPTTPAAEPQPPRPAATYVVYGAGEMDFDWQNFDVLKDPSVDFRVRVPKQGLGLLSALTPTIRRTSEEDVTEFPDLAGTIQADFRWRGTLKEPAILGNILVDADHLRVARMTTQLKNLKADLVFTGNSLSVREFTAQTQVINPRNGAPVKTSDPATPIRITGEIALRRGVPVQPRVQVWPPRIVGSQLHVTGDKLVVAEAPLPVINSGRVVANDISADLTIGGTIFRPVIEGNVSLADADVRIPDALQLQSKPAVALAAPIFNLTFSVGQNVAISSSQISATVHTEPGSPVVLKGDVADRSTMQVAGNLVIDKGNLNLPTARFAIQRGGIVSLRYPSYDFGSSLAGALNDPTLGINVDLTAITRLTATSVNGVSKRYTITVEARGPINTSAPIRLGDAGANGVGLLGERSLQLTFKSDPNDLALTSTGLQQRVVGLLGGQSALESIFTRNPDVGRLLRTQLTNALSNAFLPELFEKLGIGQALGLEEFSIDINQLSYFMLRVTRQLIGPFYVTYLQRLSGSSGATTSTSPDNFGWEFRLSYRFPMNMLRANLQLSLSTDDQKTNAVLLEGVFKF